jgi:amidophosphoribosyltransferase
MILSGMSEHCGIFGVFNHSAAAEITYLGLYALQHRGQESSGIAVSDGSRLAIHKEMGLVSQVFKGGESLAKLKGPHAIGYNRYSTTGSSTIINAQPILIDFKAGQIAGAHNGNLTNANLLRGQMEKDGSIFMSTTDTEVIMHLLAHSRRATIEQMILESLSNIQGAYSMLFLTPKALFGVRDPRGRSCSENSKTPGCFPLKPAPLTLSAPRSSAKSNRAKWSKSARMVSPVIRFPCSNG